jgi:hypothetical protein
MKVFWSWQSDTPGNIGRHMIRDVLDSVVQDLKMSSGVDEPFREVHLDQDRKGVPGSPEVARVILEKIEKAAVFVADVTTVGVIPQRSEDAEPKKLINSNVAIELGYALGKLSDRALLMVMNEHYGGRSDLPFDLRSRAGPISYKLEPGASKEAIAEEVRMLKPIFKSALRSCLENRGEETRRVEIAFPAAREKDGPGRFRPQGEPLGILSSFPAGFGPDGDIFLAYGPAQWLRLMPINDPRKIWPVHELREIAHRNAYQTLQPFSSYGDYSFQAGDGFGRCSLETRDSSETASVAFAFETGEIWSVDTAYLSFDDAIPFLEERYAERLQEYASFLCALGLKPPFRWICGMVDVRERRLKFPIPPGRTTRAAGPKCLSQTFNSSGQYNCEESPKSALYPFFKLLFEKCGIPRPAYLDQ